MAKVEIQIKTAADLAALQKTTAETEKTVAAVNKLTEATDRQTKSAAESAKVFQEAAKSRNNATDQAAYLTGLTKEAKETVNTEKATSSLVRAKAGLISAGQKLSSYIPGWGFLIGSLKNPYVALAAVIALAITELQKFFSEVDRMRDAVRSFDTLNLSIRDFGEVLKGNAADRAKYVRDLGELAKFHESNREALQRVTQQIENMGVKEERAAEKRKQIALEGITDIKERARIEEQFDREAAQREEAKQQRLANAIENKSRAAFEKSEAAAARLPAADEELDQATIGRERAERLAQAHEDFGAGRFGSRAGLVKNVQDLRDKQELAGPNQKVSGLAEAELALREYDNQALAISRMRRGAQARETVASENVGRIRGEVIDNYQEGTGLARDAGLAYDRIGQLRANSGPQAPSLGRGSAQYRFDAQVQALGERVSAAIESSYNQVIKRLNNLESQAKRQMSTD